jgi:hypothetical protein
MMLWLGRHALWLTIRSIITLACIEVVYQLMAHEGYRCDFTTLLIGAVCTIIACRCWTPSGKEREHVLPLSNH